MKQHQHWVNKEWSRKNRKELDRLCGGNNQDRRLAIRDQIEANQDNSTE